MDAQERCDGLLRSRQHRRQRRAAVGASLGYILELGVENIQQHRQPLLRRLQQETPRLGFTPATPSESTSPIVTFGTKDGATVQKKLQAANVNARVSRSSGAFVAIGLQRDEGRGSRVGGALVINSPTTFLRTIAALAFVLGTVPVLGQGPHVENIFSTRHQAVVGGKTIQYTATAGLLPIYVNDTGQQMASVFFIAYTVERPQGQPPRPITFLWNGGPGSKSAQIHVVGFGPKRVKTADTYPAWGPNTETEMVDNQEMWLDTSELVSSNPVGTGFSRATKEEYRDILYTPRGDAEAVAELIRLYRTASMRGTRPLFWRVRATERRER